MALLFGFFFACIVALLAFLPFGLIILYIAWKGYKAREPKLLTKKTSIIVIILFIIGAFVAVEVFQSMMGSVADSLNP